MARQKLPDFKQNYEKYQEKIKRYADNRRHVKPQEIKIGDSGARQVRGSDGTVGSEIAIRPRVKFSSALFLVGGLQNS